MQKKLIIGLDLSLNSSGISIGYFEDKYSKKLELYRLVFDDESTKKQWEPKPIINVNQIVYRLPCNIDADELIVSDTDIVTKEQNEATIKSLIASKNIGKIILSAIQRLNPNEVFFCLESFIMPSFSGKNQLKQVGALIMMQGFVREILIRLKVSDSFKFDDFKIFILSPSENKKLFSGNGSADKQFMIDHFFKYHDGDVLLPNGKEKGLKIDDIIDAYSLMVSAYKKSLNYSKSKNTNKILTL